MAAERSRRDNAGAKMSGLLDKEEEDEFYKTTYGVFDEVGDDKDFNYNSPDEAEDEVDSDFSIDENDDPKSDPEDEETARKKVKVCRLSNSIISDFLTFLSPEERGCSDQSL